MYEVIYDKRGKNSCINLLPVPGKLRCQDVACSLLASCLGVVARIPSINFRFQGLTCGFFSSVLISFLGCEMVFFDTAEPASNGYGTVK